MQRNSRGIVGRRVHYESVQRLSREWWVCNYQLEDSAVGDRRRQSGGRVRGEEGLKWNLSIFLPTAELDFLIRNKILETDIKLFSLLISLLTFIFLLEILILS
jgi:hypothetical protein